MDETPGESAGISGPDVTSQAQRAAVALADLLRATVDSATSDPAAGGLLAAQRRGRATATLGEIRNRADVLLFWGVDPNQRYPRFLSRYALEPAGTHVPDGRAGRLVIAVNIGADKGPAEADYTITLEPAEEIAALSVMRAAVLDHPARDQSPNLASAIGLIGRLTSARYAVLVHDAEPTDVPRNPLRAEGLIALAQALNGPTRAALSSLRAGGNRPGAEAVLDLADRLSLRGGPSRRISPVHAGEIAVSTSWSWGLRRRPGGGLGPVWIAKPAAALGGSHGGDRTAGERGAFPTSRRDRYRRRRNSRRRYRLPHG